MPNPILNWLVVATFSKPSKAHSEHRDRKFKRKGKE